MSEAAWPFPSVNNPPAGETEDMTATRKRLARKPPAPPAVDLNNGLPKRLRAA